MLPKALAIDLDGTLLDPNEKLSDRNRAALTEASRRGIHVILATARWLQNAKRVALELDLSGPLIACSGAQVHLLADDTDVFDIRLPHDFARQLAAICDANRCIAWFGMDERVLMKAEGEFSLDGLDEIYSTRSLSDELPVAPRIAMIQGTRIQQIIREALAPEWEQRVRFVISITTQGKELLTLTATGADKGAALRATCAHLGISTAEVVAFGDAENDIELFEAAGMSYAMGQASDAVKAAATSITTSNADDGVGRAVESILERTPT